MALSAFVGSFTVPATAIDKVVTGVGFLPKVVFFWGDGQTSDAALGTGAAAAMAPYWGVGISSSSRVAISEGDDGATGNPTGSDNTKCIKRISGSTPTTVFAADVVSLDSDGFTVHFSTVNGTAYVVNYLALGGADLTNVALVSFTSKATGGSQSTTGVGFQPDAILLMGADTSSSNNSTTFGLGRSSSSRGTSSQGANATTGGRIQKATQVYSNVDGGSSVRCEADLTSLDADGFTLNWGTGSANTHTVYALCLKGGSYKVGSFTQKTSAGAQGTTGVGFQPTGLLCLSVGQTAGAALGSIQYIMTGAASGSTHRAASQYDSGGFPVAALDRTNVYVSYGDDGTPTLQGKADLTSFDADGFTLTYTSPDATAREVIYLAMGNAAAGGGRTTKNTRSNPLGVEIGMNWQGNL